MNESTGESSEVTEYFGDERIDEEIDKTEWTVTGDEFSDIGEIIDFQKPDKLEVIEIEAHNFPEGQLRNFVIYDTNKAEVKTVTWKDTPIPERPNTSDGWKVMDSNIVRGIYVRTKPTI